MLDMKRYCLPATLMIMAASTAAPLRAEVTLLQVDWSNAEVKSFVEQREADDRNGLAPAEATPLDKVKLPVLVFQGAPGIVQSAFSGLGPQPAGDRKIHTDSANPVWYQVVDTYGDITVSVEADLRVQHSFGNDYPVYDTPSSGAAASAGPKVSTFDGQVEEGMEGFIAEYTIKKFGVPYTVTIECTAAAKEKCADTAQIAKDSDLLKIVAASPPK